MMAYADSELQDSAEEQYTDTLRPPLFLLISLLLSHAIELALIGDDPIVKNTKGLAGMVSDNTTLLFLRLFVFSVFPLVMATRLVLKSKIGLSRATLRLPFYSHCYIAAPFALVVGLAGTVMRCHWPWAAEEGLALLLFALLPYGIVQSLWFAKMLRVSMARGFLNASIGMIASLVFVSCVGPLFT
jgi:hypothetical protein